MTPLFSQSLTHIIPRLPRASERVLRCSIGQGKNIRERISIYAIWNLLSCEMKKKVFDIDCMKDAWMFKRRLVPILPARLVRCSCLTFETPAHSPSVPDSSHTYGIESRMNLGGGTLRTASRDASVLRCSMAADSRITAQTDEAGRDALSFAVPQISSPALTSYLSPSSDLSIMASPRHEALRWRCGFPPTHPLLPPLLAPTSTSSRIHTRILHLYHSSFQQLLDC